MKNLWLSDFAETPVRNLNSKYSIISPKKITVFGMYPKEIKQLKCIF